MVFDFKIVLMGFIFDVEDYCSCFLDGWIGLDLFIVMLELGEKIVMVIGKVLMISYERFVVV